MYTSPHRKRTNVKYRKRKESGKKGKHFALSLREHLRVTGDIPGNLKEAVASKKVNFSNRKLNFLPSYLSKACS